MVVEIRAESMKTKQEEKEEFKPEKAKEKESNSIGVDDEDVKYSAKPSVKTLGRHEDLIGEMHCFFFSVRLPRALFREVFHLDTIALSC